MPVEMSETEANLGQVELRLDNGSAVNRWRSDRRWATEPARHLRVDRSPTVEAVTAPRIWSPGAPEPGLLHAAPDFGASPGELYAAALEQCEWGERVGFVAAIIHGAPRHHRRIPALADRPGLGGRGRTRRMIITIALMLLPLYEPLRAAEDIAVLDLVAQGRLYLVVGGGYREEEYEQFGLSLGERPARMEHAVKTLKLAWTGEPFDYKGRTVRILPRPVHPGGPPIVLGGTSKAAARRAARIATGSCPRRRSTSSYREELARLGRPVPPDAQGLRWSPFRPRLQRP